MKLTITFLFIIVCNISFAQVLKGYILSAENNQPIQGASVYISNSSKGTVSLQDGSFTLENLPIGNITLVVSCIGFETYSNSIDVSQNGNYSIKIVLTQKISELQEVKLTVWEKDGFKKWGDFFLEHFIGNMEEATYCTIKNPEVLKFKHDKKNNTLLVKAFKTLVIENKALGYVINYDLEGFEYDFNKRVLFYYGYQLFKEMETKRNGKLNKWINKRNEVYKGSMMHFIRALYKNQLEEEGFDAKFIVKTPNYEKQRVATILRNNFNAGTQIITIGESKKNDTKSDSSNYYNSIIKQPNEFSYLINKPIKADSIVTIVDATTKELSFNDHLQVVYKYKQEPDKYLQQNWLSNKFKTSNATTSTINLLGSKKIKIYENGQYIYPTEILSSGWWGWSEKIAYLLPLDFMPTIGK
jgi:hypothetical protein